MNLPEISVRRPVAATMIMLIIMVLGAVSLMRLGLDFFPDMQFPQVSVVATYPGASSDEVETIITRPLEESTATVAGVRKVKSSSREGLALIQAELNWNSNLDLVAQDIRNMMDIAYDMLPDEVERPLVIKTDFDLMPVLYFGVLSTTGRDLRNLRKLIEDVVEKRIETVPGVASVTVSGAWSARSLSRWTAGASRPTTSPLTTSCASSATRTATYPAGMSSRAPANTCCAPWANTALPNTLPTRSCAYRTVARYSSATWPAL